MSKALVQTLLQDGMAAAKQGNVELARQSFAKVVQHDPNHEYGWLWLALVVESSQQSIYCLNRVLELNPANDRAQSALNHLQSPAGTKAIASKKKAPKAIRKSKNKSRKKKVAEPAEAVIETESIEPAATALQEISQEATLVATVETAEVRSFKKRFATGKLPGTGSLSLTDEWLPADLLPDPEIIPEELVTEAVAEELEPDPEEIAAAPVTDDERLPAATENSLISGNHAASDPAVTNGSYSNGIPAQTVPLSAPPIPPQSVPSAAIVPVRHELPVPATRREIPTITDSEPPAEFSTITPPATGPCILVVDDSQTVRRLVKITLDRLGFNVVEAKDGFEALAQLANRVPDLILLDITMPRMDGYQVCRIVKENGSTRHIPVIMLSGKDGFFDRVKGRLAGATDYVTKPFEPGALYHSIQSHLEKKR